MLDPRIYRTGMIFVLFALILVAFSLESQPGAASTTLVPDAFNGAGAFAEMRALAADSPVRGPGSVGDDAVASQVAAKLRGYGYQVSEQSQLSTTPRGPRTLLSVTGYRPGLSAGTIAIVAARDASGSPATSALSGTAVLLELARVLAGDTQQHEILFASVSGSPGALGAASLIKSLPGPVDAVLVLGDLDARDIREPVVVPYSNHSGLAPPRLRNTVAAAIATEGGPHQAQLGLDLQLAHLALPLTTTAAGPFNAAGIPAVLVSLAGAREPAAGEATAGPALIGQMGRGVLRAVDAIDSAGAVPPPGAYLLIRGKVLPAWALRLLVLVALLPMLAVGVDGSARAGRRGFSVFRWGLTILARALPLAVGAAVLTIARAVGALDAPPALVGPGQAPLNLTDVAVLALAALLALAVFFAVRLLVPAPRPRIRRAQEPPSDAPSTGWRNPGAASATLLCLTGVSLLVWVQNPFAALLLVPAVHLWGWAADPDLRPPLVLRAVLYAIGLLPPLLVIYVLAAEAGLGIGGVLWSGSLLVAGGGLGFPTLLEWCVLLAASLAAGACVLTRGSPIPESERGAGSVRGPAGYAGPGSLGGTESALRR